MDGLLDSRPQSARQVQKTTYHVALVPTDDGTIVTVLERRWMGRNMVPRRTHSGRLTLVTATDWEADPDRALSLALAAAAVLLET